MPRSKGRGRDRASFSLIQPHIGRIITPARGRGRVLTDLIHTRGPLAGRIIPSAGHNILTRTGLARLDTANFTALASLVDTCKVGTGLTTPADTDTALTTLLESKDIGSVDTSNVSGSTPYTILRTQFDEDEAIGNVSEVGLFYADGGMFNHAFFGTGNITGATQADPCVVTDADHGLITGQRIRIDSVLGMTQLNFSGSNYYYVSVLSSSTFSLYNDAALSDTVDSTGYGAYSSGGVWKIIIPKTSSTILVVRIEFQMANA